MTTPKSGRGRTIAMTPGLADCLTDHLRRAQALGVRPLEFHAARHTYASPALASGKSVS
jgi:hypothetical protein